MKNRLVIVGAGGFGREVHSWVRQSPVWATKHSIAKVAFVDDATPSIPVSAPQIGSIRDFVPADSDLVLVAVGTPKIRETIVTELADKRANFVTFVADNAAVGDRVSLGRGVIVCPLAVITADIVIGDQVHINVGSTVGHDVQIADFVTLSSVCNLTGGVLVERGAFLGTAVTVIPQIVIGQRAYVGAGSVVIRNVPAETKAFGNPAKLIGRVSA